MELFLIGLLSALDAITDLPIGKALPPLSLDAEVVNVLLVDHSGPLGRIFGSRQ